MNDTMKFKVKFKKYSADVWAIGISLVHIDYDTVLYIKLFKWCLTIGYVYDEWF